MPRRCGLRQPYYKRSETTEETSEKFPRARVGDVPLFGLLMEAPSHAISRLIPDW